ncbi:MAG: cytochrome-c peroxidase, partial [Crocinitomicaceae bacterium]|nr:cytochrome-c peroxidase [Crocinitomicaceae bacterium]
NPMTVEGVALGRKLFWEPMLSGNNTMSCGTCHAPQAAFSDTNQFSTGITGAVGTRNSMALMNLGWQQFFFWDGRAATLEDQIFEPIRNPIEMNDTWVNVVSKLQADSQYPGLFEDAFGEPGIDSVKASKAIAQFLRTMISADSDFDVMYKFYNGFSLTSTEMARFQAISLDAKAGYGLVQDLSGADCVHCHQGPFMQVMDYSNNGLDAVLTDLGLGEVTGDPQDYGKFKIPTLRNIELSAPYMHDGRFQTLEDVVMHYSYDIQASSPNLDKNRLEYWQQGGVQLNTTEINQVVEFLKSMTDMNFVNNPDFQDPN